MGLENRPKPPFSRIKSRGLVIKRKAVVLLIYFLFQDEKKIVRM